MRLIEALRLFGFGSLNLSPSDFGRPDQILQLGVRPNRIDVITSISGIQFEDAWATRVPGEIGDAPTYYLDAASLLRNKLATGRPQDLRDADELTKRLGRKDP